MAETMKIVSTSLLGLTVGCAQCHAHRYDPISQEDYYRFRAVFEPALDGKNWRVPNGRLVSLWTEADRKRAAQVNVEVERLWKERMAALNDLVKHVLDKEIDQAPADVRDRSARPRPRRSCGKRQHKKPCCWLIRASPASAWALCRCTMGLKPGRSSTGTRS